MSVTNSFQKFHSAQEKRNRNTPPYQRLKALFDPDSFVEVGGFTQREDQEVQLVCGFGQVQGAMVYAFSQSGALGIQHMEKMEKIYQLALQNGSPIVGFYDSEGLHLSDGGKILDGFARVLSAQNRLSGVVPQISVVVGPCIGTNATLACTADFLFMSKDGSFFSTPPTSEVSDEVASALRIAEEGVAHLALDTEEEVIAAAQKVLSMLPLNNLDPLPASDFSPNSGDPEALRRISQGDIRQTDELVGAVVDAGSVIELFPEYGTGVYAAMATMEGTPCGVIAPRGGLLQRDDCVKIARLVSVWDSFHLPTITFVDSEGMSTQGASAARDMAKISHVYAEATAPKIAVITGAAYGSSYMALASLGATADYSVAWPNGVISPLTPQTAVAFLEAGRISKEKSRKELEEEYQTETASALSAAKLGLINDVIAPEDTRKMLLAVLELLATKRVEKLPKKHGNIPF